MQALLFAVQSILIPLACALATYRLVESGVWPTWMAQLRRELGATSSRLDEATERLDAVLAQVSEETPISLALPKWERTPPGLLDWLANDDRADETVDALWPAMAALVLAFVVSRALAAVYECVVDTILVCALRDQAHHIPRPCVFIFLMPLNPSYICNLRDRRSTGRSIRATRYE